MGEYMSEILFDKYGGVGTIYNLHTSSAYAHRNIILNLLQKIVLFDLQTTYNDGQLISFTNASNSANCST